MTSERVHNDVYVEREGTGVGTILGVILAVAVVLAIIWFFFLGGMQPGPVTPGTDTNQNQVQQQQPDNGVPGNVPPPQ